MGFGGLRQYLGGEETDKRGRAVAGNAWDGRRGLCQMEEIYVSLGDEERAKRGWRKGRFRDKIKSILPQLLTCCEHWLSVTRDREGAPQDSSRETCGTTVLLGGQAGHSPGSG